ncbi:hypothetical protein FM107_05220 [Sphingobacterium sp. JB170]|nr:hypothetical protein FM107_05220 [Sphingobacterium sp. JB170]
MVISPDYQSINSPTEGSRLPKETGHKRRVGEKGFSCVRAIIEGKVKTA